MKFRLSLSAVAAAALLLTGCGGPPADGGAYSTATELKDAFVKAGGKCGNWTPEGKSVVASTSGSCDSTLLYVFTDMDDREFIVQKMRDSGVGAVAGQNWVILVADGAGHQKLLGGELILTK